MVRRGLLVVAVLLTGLGVRAFGSDADVKALLERVKAQDAKIAELEKKMTSGKSVATAVDQAIAKTDAKMGSVITAADPAGCRPLTIGGNLDISYQYNFNRPDNQNNNLRTFDTDSNGFNVHNVQLNFSRLPTEAGQAGFFIETSFGTDQRTFSSQDSASNPAQRFSQFKDVDLKQAYLEYIAPVGNGVTIDFGKYVTWAGEEVIESGNNINSSHSFLFGYAIPFAHTGVRATYDVFKGSECCAGKWTVGLGVVNGWDNSQDQNNSKTVMMESNWTPVKWFNWVVVGIAGNEDFADERARFAAGLASGDIDPADPFGDPSIAGVGAAIEGANWDPGDSHGFRGLADTTLTFTPWDKWTFVINADYAIEHAHPWWGVAGYLKYQFAKNWYIANRTEYFSDKDGVRTGTEQDLWESTITADWAVSDPLHIRFEYRHDGSNRQVFSSVEGIHNDGPTHLTPFEKRHQDTFMVNWLYKF